VGNPPGEEDSMRELPNGITEVCGIPELEELPPEDGPEPKPPPETETK
jgi:hypothetical protein